jgi:nicotinamidase-related amidase
MELKLNPLTTALVLIDLQKGIVSRPLAPHSGAHVVEKAVLLASRFVETGSPVVRVHVGFAADGADRLQQPIDAPMQAPPGGYAADFMEFAPEIASLPSALTITKRQWGAFYGTELDLQLRRRGINTIVLGGIATNFGVESTAREAWQENYALVIAEDACTSMDIDMHRFSIEKILPRLGRVRKTTEIIAAIESEGRSN